MEGAMRRRQYHLLVHGVTLAGMTALFPAKSLDSARYAQTFAVFISRSHEYPAMLDRLAVATSDLRNGFACLDVGAGDGMMIRDWLARGGNRPGRYVAIEPIAVHASALRQTLSAIDIPSEVSEAPLHPEFAISGLAVDCWRSCKVPLVTIRCTGCLIRSCSATALPVQTTVFPATNSFKGCERQGWRRKSSSTPPPSN